MSLDVHLVGGELTVPVSTGSGALISISTPPLRPERCPRCASQGIPPLVLERAPQGPATSRSCPPPPTNWPAVPLVPLSGGTGEDDVAILCLNTTEAINHLAYRLQLLKGPTSS